MILPETVQIPQKPDRSKTITTKIPILINPDGCPALPTVSMADGYKTKAVQIMLREYCIAHIRESSFYLFVAKGDTYDLGFVTGRKKQIVPWGTLVKDPSSWISGECVPDGFEWKDPSKIQIGEIFRLLYHWMDRQEQGLDPLIWLPTCPIFQDVEHPSTRRRNIRQARVQQPQMSDEEEFDLPSSGDINEEENMDISDDTETSDESPTGSSSSEHAESIDLDIESPLMHVSQQEKGSSGEFIISSV